MHRGMDETDQSKNPDAQAEESDNKKTKRSPGRRAVDTGAASVDRRTGLDRRRGPGRRRSDARKAAEEGEMTEEQFDFILAIEEYKKVNNRPFPSWTEILDIIKAIGYRKVADPQDIE